jgi:ubiquinone/menaquinone biosynthesis C-methylase UbiE
METIMHQNTMTLKTPHVCEAEHSFALDNWIRKLIHQPKRILGDYIGEGDTVVDIGCGPGFFTIPMAEMVGPSGRVIAVDLQNAMLDRVKAKTAQHGFGERVDFHQCQSNKIDLDLKADFILAYYMVHETPDPQRFLSEVKSMLKPGGKLLVVEPPIHVRKTTFQAMLVLAENVGLKVLEFPKRKGGMSVLYGV